MRTLKNNKKTAGLNPLYWILWCLGLVTLYFQITLADPFNAPKLWVLLLFAGWLAGYLFILKNEILKNDSLKILLSLISIFVITLSLSTFFSNIKYVAFFGDTQRRNGFFQYLALSLILILTATAVTFENIKKIYLTTYLIAIVSAFYSLLQLTGNDFVKWNNPYNSIISTVGNPNFAAAVMAIMGVILFSTIFIEKFSLTFRISSGFIFLLLIFLIYKSNARQGLLAFFLGAGIFLNIWLWGKNRKIGFMFLIAGLSIFVLAILGMLQMGPLEKYLYKPSVSIRGYYWRAGIQMFLKNPFFGVGIDSYGYYFKEFREVNYPLIYGYEITSSNAHNTFIQFFATGGLLFGLSYLIINSFILVLAIKRFSTLSGDNKLILSGLLSAWFAYHAQSLVSIDNIGISVWGWILGGAIVALSKSKDSNSSDLKEIYLPNKNNLKSIQILTSSVIVFLIFIPIMLLYKGEENSAKASVLVNLQNPVERDYFQELQKKVIDSPLNDPSYKLIAASRLIQSGFVNDGITAAKKILNSNSRQQDALLLLAETYESMGDLLNANIYRDKISALDPWNAANYFLLGKNYQALGDTTSSRRMLTKILSFAPNTTIAELAKVELQG